MSKMVVLMTLVSLLLLCSCAANQKLSVTTDPPGAQVTLVRYGITKAEGGLPGVSVGTSGENFEDPPITLGTSPLDYEFKLQETAKELSIGGVYAKVTRTFTEGLVRAEKDGRVAERRVLFMGKPLAVDLLLPAQ